MQYLQNEKKAELFRKRFLPLHTRVCLGYLIWLRWITRPCDRWKNYIALCVFLCVGSGICTIQINQQKLFLIGFLNAFLSFKNEFGSKVLACVYIFTEAWAWLPGVMNACRFSKHSSYFSYRPPLVPLSWLVSLACFIVKSEQHDAHQQDETLVMLQHGHQSHWEYRLIASYLLKQTNKQTNKYTTEKPDIEYAFVTDHCLPPGYLGPTG